AAGGQSGLRVNVLTMIVYPALLFCRMSVRCDAGLRVNVLTMIVYPALLFCRMSVRCDAG
ncbi:hypothetical protein ACRWGR_25305, partial [Escherichia coli]